MSIQVIFLPKDQLIPLLLDHMPAEFWNIVNQLGDGGGGYTNAGAPAARLAKTTPRPQHPQHARA